MISELANLPDISFIDDMTLTRLQAKMVSDFQTRYKEITNTEYALQRADPVSLCLYAAAVQIYQAMLYVDHKGKMNLLKYSTGDYLDHLGAFCDLNPPGDKSIRRESILCDYGICRGPRR